MFGGQQLRNGCTLCCSVPSTNLLQVAVVTVLYLHFSGCRVLCGGPRDNAGEKPLCLGDGHRVMSQTLRLG